MGNGDMQFDENGNIKRAAKDSVFTHLFQDKEYLLQLYQALHPEDTEAEEKDLTIITLKNIVSGGIYNDLGFMLKEKIIFLIEAQSTWTVNILVRVLMYLAKSYQDYIIRKGQNIYGSKRVKLPKAELYVIYTGDRKTRPDVLSFAQEFFPGQDSFLDIKVKMIYGDGTGDIISQYVAFTKIFDEQVKKYGYTEQAVRETIRICKDMDVLKKYLESRESEVVDLMITLFSDEEIQDMRERSIRRETAIETTVEEGKDYGASREKIFMKLQRKFDLSEEEAEEMMELYWQ